MTRVLEIEWRIPWPADWSIEKKIKACERLRDYMTEGTFFDTTTRRRVADVQIVQLNKHDDPFITLRLE